MRLYLKSGERVRVLPQSDNTFLRIPEGVVLEELNKEDFLLCDICGLLAVFITEDKHPKCLHCMYDEEPA